MFHFAYFWVKAEVKAIVLYLEKREASPNKTTPNPRGLYKAKNERKEDWDKATKLTRHIVCTQESANSLCAAIAADCLQRWPMDGPTLSVQRVEKQELKVK